MCAAKAFRIPLLIMSVVLLGACASSRPVVEWQDEAYEGQLDNILVIAVVEENSLRRTVEDAYVEKFTELSISATPGYTLLSSTAELSRETVGVAIEGKDIDSVLVTRLLGVEQVEQYHPPTYQGYYGSYDSFYRHSMAYSSPGYYSSYTLLKLESNLYDAVTGELVWSMQSESMDSSAKQDVIKGQVGLTVKRLGAAGLIVPVQ
jgi:hypothetical protein